MKENLLKSLRIFTGMALLSMSSNLNEALAQDAISGQENTPDALYKQSLEKSLADMDLFTDGLNHYILQTQDNQFFWGNGSNFYKLQSKGLSSTWKGGQCVECKMTFEDPRVEKSENTQLFRTGDIIKVMNYKPDFTLIKDPSEIGTIKYRAHFIPLPEIRQAEYLLRFKDREEYIFVDASATKYSYNSFRLFKGSLGEMGQFEIPKNSALRSRDGGTTYISLQDGSQLYVPTVFSEGEGPYWKDSNEIIWPLERVKGEFDYTRLGINDFPSEKKVFHTPLDLILGVPQ